MTDKKITDKIPVAYGSINSRKDIMPDPSYKEDPVYKLVKYVLYGFVGFVGLKLGLRFILAFIFYFFLFIVVVKGMLSH